MFGDNGVRSDEDVPGPDGEPLRDAAGRKVTVPMVRPTGVSPPCRDCPKRAGDPDKSPLPPDRDPCADGWAVAAIEHARGLLAWGERPPDPLVRAVGRLVAEADRRLAQREQADAIGRAVRAAVQNRR